jgi:adenylosuccinate synthase
MGIGETASDAINYPNNTLYVKDILNKDVLSDKLRWFRSYKQKQLYDNIAYINASIFPIPDLITEAIRLLSSEEELDATIEVYTAVAKRLQIVDGNFLNDKLKNETVVFEGAQGILLDENWGFYPYTTWSKTTPTNALTLIEEAGCINQSTVIGVVRAYSTRHGVGPFVTENYELNIPDTFNKFNMWQEDFRVGWFDAVAIRYAIAAAGRIDSIAVTCVDRLKDLPIIKLCYAYECNNPNANKYFDIKDNLVYNIKLNKPVDLKYQENLGRILEDCKPLCHEFTLGYEHIPKLIQRELGVPVSITSFGKKYTDKQFKIYPKKGLENTLVSV